MLSTLAMFVTGVAVVYQARKRTLGDVMPVDTRVLWMDMRTFAVAYALAIGAAFLLAYLIRFDSWFKQSSFIDSGYLDATIDVMREKGVIVLVGSAIALTGEHVHPSPPKSVGYRDGDMHVHVKRQWHTYEFPAGRRARRVARRGRRVRRATAVRQRTRSEGPESSSAF